MPKTDSPLSNSTRQYSSVTELRKALGGTNDIKRILIANNGLAAVKGINSIRQWFYDHLGIHEAVEFAVMATPEDLQANAEFISMADQHVEVPGGPNSNNYANVDLIMHTASQCMCDAIYPGWGHASENPAMPRECDRTRRVVFLGPSEEAMFALGDKIASTIVAQSNGVPCVPWSGDQLFIEEGTFDVDTSMYERAYVTSVEECEKVCERVGFPVMIKASEGGGGKGIRRCTRLEDVREMFLAVTEEVKGCHIFVMRMMENVRHLEVQLLADRYGDCIAVRTRDCSVQRRHQKIIEEGPVFGVSEDVVLAMELSAIRLAKAVRYSGLGTVEFMYDKNTGKFFFLELNPRIQVEHPVSELISGVNLPAALLCVGMGIPLYRIPEVRAMYGETPYSDSVITFDTTKSLPAKGHTIAVRVTAENAEEGFRPTSGKVEEITFRNSKECWGYFSIPSGGEVHQYADSQFGHIFSSGATREDARRGMVMALRNLVIRGEIHTTTSYVLDLLERHEFRDCDVSTAWLDGLIAQRAMEGPRKESVHVSLLAACIFRMMRCSSESREKYASYLTAGHIPSTESLEQEQTESYVCRSEKFSVRIGKMSATEYAVSLNGSIAIVPCRTLKSGALQMTVGGKTVIAYAEMTPTSIRITIGGKDTTFSGDIDPTKLFSSVPGRLVRYSVADGGHVAVNGTYAEIEVMKMILPLRATTAGRVYHRSNAGSTITAGTLLAEIVPDDPSSVARPQDNKDPWPINILHSRLPEKLDGYGRARRAVDVLWNVLQGFHFSEIPLKERLQRALDDVSSVCLSSVSIKALNYPFIAVEDCDVQSPNDKLRVVLSGLIGEYIRVERFFDGYGRQEALTYLRDNKEADETYMLDYTHKQPCHHEVIKTILGYVEQNNALMKSLQETLSSLVELRSYEYGSLLLQARYLLRQCSLPTFAERKSAFSKDIELGDFDEMMNGGYSFDILCAVMFDRQTPHLIQLCLELFVRWEYAGEYTVLDLDIFKTEGIWMGTYRCDPLEEYDPLRDDEATHVSKNNSFGSTNQKEIAGYVAMFSDEGVMRNKIDGFLRNTCGNDSRDQSVCTIFFSVGRETTQDDASNVCSRILEENESYLKELKSLRYVSFIVHGMEGGPHTFTFRQSLGFEEDLLIRNVAPLSARRLELDRLSNYSVSMYPSPFKDVHIFKAAPKKQGATFLENRMFVRLIITPRDLGIPAWTEATVIDAGYMLAKCLSALEFARNDTRIKYPVYNHIFIKMVELTFDVSSIGKLLSDVATSYQHKLVALGVMETEIAFQVKLPNGFVPFRVTLSNPVGYSLQIHVYYEWLENGVLCLRRAEAAEDLSFANLYHSSAEDVPSLVQLSTNGAEGLSSRQRTVNKLLELRSKLPARADVTPLSSEFYEDTAADGFSKNGSAAQSSDAVLASPTSPTSPLFDNLAIPLVPYPMLSDAQVKRLQARNAQTTYVYDWVLLMEIAVQRGWYTIAQKRGFPRERIPKRVLKATELFVSRTSNKLTTQKSQRSPCGMVVWSVDYFPPKYMNLTDNTAPSRNIIVVANDITFQSGSFAVPEDVVFAAASELARERNVPFVYLSANSGARVGLSAEVKKRFRVSFTATNEIEYLYLTEDDYNDLAKKNVRVETIPVTINGEPCHAIRGIVGGESEYLGVENLRGSALLAGHMSKSYFNIPTISVVSGRSVGIGAYLNRLGRRVIQTNDAPLILTGASALNRLLGKDVYTDNSQLGGRQVMVPNGVTHWETNDDLRSIRTMLDWLDFVPPVVYADRCSPRLLTLPTHDPVDRDVTFSPQPGEPYDPRLLVTGNFNVSGMFDRGSWMETMEGWAKTVVAGRAALGGIPCGVILVETRVTKKFSPADPADPTSSASFTAQAGQVWFPDSARKTADALDDFHRERLPCFIFANWRGFSGGMRDMYDEVLKFGASIVDNLRVYNCPVFIYIPPFGELRGGAWVVVDPVINHCGAVEMYCDTTARGGILEPSAVVEIKFRDNDVRELIRRCNPSLASLDPKAARDEETQMVPRYRDVALRFADLHDGPARMKAKGVVVDVIPWKESRRMFHAKLTRKLKELDVATTMVANHTATSLQDATEKLHTAYEAESNGELWGVNDAACLAWLEANSAKAVHVDAAAIEKADMNGSSSSSHVDELLSKFKNSLAGNKDSMESCFAALFDDPEVYAAAKSAMARVVTQEIGDADL